MSFKQVLITLTVASVGFVLPAAAAVTNLVGGCVIVDGSFAGCDPAATKIVFPAGLDEIPANCCRGFSALTEVDVPQSVRYIGTGAFAGCKSLAKVVFAEGVTALDENVFDGCSSISSLDMPASVEVVGRLGDGLSALKSLTFEGSAPRVYQRPGDAFLAGTPADLVIFVRRGTWGWGGHSKGNELAEKWPLSGSPRHRRSIRYHQDRPEPKTEAVVKYDTVIVDEGTSVEGAAGWTALNVPEGMTWDSTTGRFKGAPIKEGTNTVYLLGGAVGAVKPRSLPFKTATGKKATVVLAELPGWATGSFTGYVRRYKGDSPDDDAVGGVMVCKVTQAGLITGRIFWTGSSEPVKFASFSACGKDSFVAEGSCSRSESGGNETMYYSFTVRKGLVGVASLKGQVAHAGLVEHFVCEAAHQNPWLTKTAAEIPCVPRDTVKWVSWEGGAMMNVKFGNNGSATMNFFPSGSRQAKDSACSQVEIDAYDESEKCWRGKMYAVFPKLKWIVSLDISLDASGSPSMVVSDDCAPLPPLPSFRLFPYP